MGGGPGIRMAGGAAELCEGQDILTPMICISKKNLLLQFFNFFFPQALIFETFVVFIILARGSSLTSPVLGFKPELKGTESSVLDEHVQLFKDLKIAKNVNVPYSQAPRAAHNGPFVLLLLSIKGAAKAPTDFTGIS